MMTPFQQLQQDALATAFVDAGDNVLRTFIKLRDGWAVALSVNK